MTTIIHTNFHKRRSGISVHVENIVPALCDLGLQAHAVGAALNNTVPQIDLNEIVPLLRSNTPMVWHAHRPHSLRKGLGLRKRYPHLRVVWTHHGWRSPGGGLRNGPFERPMGLFALPNKALNTSPPLPPSFPTVLRKKPLLPKKVLLSL